MKGIVLVIGSINLAYPKEALIAFRVGNVRSNPDSDIFTIKKKFRHESKYRAGIADSWKMSSANSLENVVIGYKARWLRDVLVALMSLFFSKTRN